MNLLSFFINKGRKGISWFLRLSLWKKLGIVILVLILLWFGISRVLGQKGNTPEYQTATVQKGILVSSVTASGTILQGSSANITTSATGIVKEVYVADGDTVAQGQKIAEITLDTDSQQKQAAAWASYLSAKANLDASNATIYSLRSAKDTAWKDFYDLSTNDEYENPDGSPKEDIRNSSAEFQSAQADWLGAEAKYKNQQGVIDQAQASVNSAWLSYVQLSSTITAPMAGKAAGLALTPGLPITSSQTTSSTSSNGINSSNSSQSVGTIIAEQSSLQASVNLTEIDVVKVKPGQKVTLILDAFPDKTFTGKVATVNTSGSVSSGVTTYPTTITFDSALDTIYSDMAVNATIITSIKDNVLLVPSSAVQTANGQSIVRVMRNSQVTPISVEIGDSNDTQTEIISGIQEGDVIVTGQTTNGTSAQGQGTTSPFGGGFGGRGVPGGGGGQIFIQHK